MIEISVSSVNKLYSGTEQNNISIIDTSSEITMAKIFMSFRLSNLIPEVATATCLIMQEFSNQ